MLTTAAAATCAVIWSDVLAFVLEWTLICRRHPTPLSPTHPPATALMNTNFGHMPYELWECLNFVAASDRLNSIVAADVDDAVSLTSPENYFAYCQLQLSWDMCIHCREYAANQERHRQWNYVLYSCIKYCILFVIIVLPYMLLIF